MCEWSDCSAGTEACTAQPQGEGHESRQACILAFASCHFLFALTVYSCYRLTGAYPIDDRMDILAFSWVVCVCVCRWYAAVGSSEQQNCVAIKLTVWLSEQLRFEIEHWRRMCRAGSLSKARVHVMH